ECGCPWYSRQGYPDTLVYKAGHFRCFEVQDPIGGLTGAESYGRGRAIDNFRDNAGLGNPVSHHAIGHEIEVFEIVEDSRPVGRMLSTYLGMCNGSECQQNKRTCTKNVGSDVSKHLFCLR